MFNVKLRHVEAPALRMHDLHGERRLLHHATIIEDLQRKVEYRKYYDGQMKNVELATL